MKAEWCYYKNEFNEDQCEKLIYECLKKPLKEASIGYQGERTSTEIRRSRINYILNEEHQFNWLFEKLWNIANMANNEWFGFNISRIPYLQFAEYDESYKGEFKNHHDVFWINNDPIYHRKITVIIQLSAPDQYEGGQFALNNSLNPLIQNEIITRGTAIVLPSFIEHRVTPVTKGKRYSLVCWVDGPKWK